MSMNELDPLGRAVDSSGAYNYDGTNDYGVPAAGFYTPGSVPGVCGTTFGVSMSCGIVRDWGIHQRSLQERIADNDWSLSRLRPNGEFWDNLDRGYVMIPEFEDHGDRREVKYRKYWINPPPPPPPPPTDCSKMVLVNVHNDASDASSDGAVSEYPYLNSVVAQDFRDAVTAMVEGGVNVGFTELFRPYVVQVEYYRRFQANIVAQKQGLPEPYPNIEKAAKPGAYPGRSNHGAGFSFDMKRMFLKRKMNKGPFKGKTVIQVFEAFGFLHNEPEDEPHFNYKVKPTAAQRLEAQNYYRDCL